jgi:DNA modification methylase
LLSQDLDFHGEESNFASHNFHSFPAKFPPQIPQLFISELTQPGDVVLDPMVGSGTSALEAYLAGRRTIGFDIDPLAQRIANVKTKPLEKERVKEVGIKIIKQARIQLSINGAALSQLFVSRWDDKTRDFINYWFLPEIQLELQALLTQIEKIQEPDIKMFFELVFSAIIITKWGGVSLALDLAHTRPHRARKVVNRAGQVLFGQEYADDQSRKTQILTKTLRSPIDEFERRFRNNLKGLFTTAPSPYPPVITFGDAQHLPLPNDSVDLIITSPPYASNAIDYMRAHKFSLIWLGYPIDELGHRRAEYIGGESTTDITFEQLPGRAAQIVKELTELDAKKGQVVHRYYSEMDRVLREMYRVLRPGKAAILVVGTSIIRGKDTETHECLADIGRAIGFEVPKIGVRNLDRDRRMLPAGFQVNRASQIQQRMHEENLIGFYKP